MPEDVKPNDFEDIEDEEDDESEEQEEQELEQEEKKKGKESILTQGKPDESKILDLIIKEYSWEAVLYNIVIAEDLNPWDIDIIKLADAFAKYISKLKELDFRVPAKVILTCSIFLRMKSEALKRKDDQEQERKRRQVKEKEPLDVSDVPEKLQMPAARRPIRKVTLQELVQALEKAFEVREKKEKRWKQRTQVMELEEDNIEDRIEILYKTVIEIIENGRDRIPFKELVEKWERERIIKTFMPMLHLVQENKISYEQKDLFDDIYVRPPKNLSEDDDFIEEDEEELEKEKPKKN